MGCSECSIHFVQPYITINDYWRTLVYFVENGSIGDTN